MTTIQAASVTRLMPEIMRDRNALVMALQAKQDRILDAIVDDRIEPNWNSILKSVDALTPAVQKRIEQRTLETLRDLSQGIAGRVEAVQVHGTFFALWSALRDGLPVLYGDPNAPQIASFEADPAAAFTVSEAARYWQEELGVSEQVVQYVVQQLSSSAVAIVTEYVRTILEKISNLFRQAVDLGWTLAEFRRRFVEVMPETSRALVETLYRTEMSREYGRRRLDLLRRSRQFVPFVQWITVGDDRVRPNHAAMNGYVAAVTDPVWDLWHVPAGYNCRCDISPIPYTEAIRRGWARREGRTLVLTRGTRPVGPPPDVRPDPGFEVQREVAA